jgi:hypothetical protein
MPDREWWDHAHPDDLQGCPRDVAHLEAYVRQLRHSMRWAADQLRSAKSWPQLRANADAAAKELERGLSDPVWSTVPNSPAPRTQVPSPELDEELLGKPPAPPTDKK